MVPRARDGGTQRRTRDIQRHGAANRRQTMALADCRQPGSSTYVIRRMTALYLSIAAEGNDQIVGRPRATDAIGAALRGAYGAALVLPNDIATLLQRLERTR